MHVCRDDDFGLRFTLTAQDGNPEIEMLVVFPENHFILVGGIDTEKTETRRGMVCWLATKMPGGFQSQPSHDAVS